MIGFPWKSSSIPGLFVTTGKSGNFSQISFPVAESRSISSTESVSPRDVCPSATNTFVKPKKCMLWEFPFYRLLKTWPKYCPSTDICGPWSLEVNIAQVKFILQLINFFSKMIENDQIISRLQ